MTDYVQTIQNPAGRRYDTGPLRIGEDWCGVFIRGDDAQSLVPLLKGCAQMSAPEDAGKKRVAQKFLEIISKSWEQA